MFRWRMTLAAFALVSIGGLILMTMLALGMADPPRTGSLQWRAQAPDQIPASLALPLAFTLEAGATNTGPADSAWGLQLANAQEVLVILIDNQGYFSVSADNRPHWAEFPHIRPFAGNQLDLHVESNGAATLRINHEIAWQGTVQAQTWAAIEHAEPALDWHGIALYHE